MAIYGTSHCSTSLVKQLGHKVKIKYIQKDSMESMPLALQIPSLVKNFNNCCSLHCVVIF